MSTSVIGDASSPFRTCTANSSRLYAMPPAGASERIGRSDDGRIMVDSTIRSFLERSGEAASRHLETNAFHRFRELFTVLGHFDGALVGTDQFDTVLLENASTVQIHRHVQGSLPTHRRKERIRLLLFDDLLDPFSGDRLDIGPIRNVGIGHDRGRVRIHQDDPITLFLEGSNRLSTRIVKLAGLADDNRSRAQNENRF